MTTTTKAAAMLKTKMKTTEAAADIKAAVASGDQGQADQPDQGLLRRVRYADSAHRQLPGRPPVLALREGACAMNMRLTKERRWTIRSLATELYSRHRYHSKSNICDMMDTLQEMVTTTRSRSWESALDFVEMDHLGRGRILLRREIADLEKRGSR